MVESGTSLLKTMEISVAEADKRTGKNTVNMQETYTVYLIETRWMTLLLPALNCNINVAVQWQLIVLVFLHVHFHSQASWKCPGRGYTSHSRHFVETLQRVWTAENIPHGHLPVHHRPSTTREKGKENTFKRWTYQDHIFYLRFIFYWLKWLGAFWAHCLLYSYNHPCASDRQSLCGTSCLQTTSTQTLSNGGESAWKISCCVLHHIPSSPMIKSSSSS